MEIEAMKMAVRYLPPTARRRAERALGLPASDGDDEQLVFVYGTLLSGERNARWAGSARRRSAWTTGRLYDTGFGFPAFVRDGRDRVVGEVLEADDSQMRSMDRLEGCPRLYRRERIAVALADGSRVEAWVYVMNRLPDGATPIPGGDWRRRNAASGTGPGAANANL